LTSPDVVHCGSKWTVASDKSFYFNKIDGISLEVLLATSVFHRGMIMRTVFGAVAGALAIVAMLVSYSLGERHAVSQAMAPMTQMVIGPDGVARPYLVQAGQTLPGQTAYLGQPGVWSPYAAAMAPQAFAPAPYAAYGAQPQYVNERLVSTQPAVRRVSTQRAYTSERAVAPRRSWQKSAMLIGGSAASGAGVGALVGGKKGAGIGALIGGGAATLYDQVKRH
jgi:hypothetical protein